MTCYTETFTLTNGVAIPKLGLGTWLIEGDAATQAVKDALKLGYRHIDTAQAYGNEAEVGIGIKESGIAREEIFVTTKVVAEAKSYDAVAASIDESLKKLGLDYLDLILIHSPQPWAEFRGGNRYFAENKEAWSAMEDAYTAGKVRAIGVSNFLKDDMENILESAEVKPMVNQVLTHISNTPLELIEYNQSKDILVEAYSPIAHGEAVKNEEIQAMAAKYNATPAQLCIRYVLQLGLVALPKTANAAHMEENGKVDFVISDEDMEALKHIERIKDYGEHSFFPVFDSQIK
jgi:diketogulonate reductase-like aldo/keto reductase